MFEIQVIKSPLSKIKSGGMLVGIFQEEKITDSALVALEKNHGSPIGTIIKEGELKGSFKEFTLIRPPELAKTLLIGLGKRKEFDLDRIRAYAAKGARTFRRLNIKQVYVPFNESFSVSPEDFASAIIEGMMMGLYRYRRWQPKERTVDQVVLKTVTLVFPEKTADTVINGVKGAIKRGTIHAEANIFCRNLVNEPAATMTPEIFCDSVVKESKGLKNLKVSVLNQKELEKLGMGALLAVARGSDNPPKLLVMKYSGGGKNDKLFGLVGKGLTYDTGGYDIKPAGGMMRMYGDMAGAAAVASTMIAVARLGLKKNIVAVAGMCENRINGKAFLSGDILTSMNGKTIEVVNTDAEGRLVLADCFTYIQRVEKAEEIIDLATLTGAMIMALGHFVTGTFSNNDPLAAAIFDAGEKSHERVWRLPVYNDYLLQIKSDVADLENSGGRPAGSITAAMFLQEFVEEGRPWLHMDIAGTSFMEESVYPYAKKPYYPKEGATGIGPRLLLHYFESMN